MLRPGKLGSRRAAVGSGSEPVHWIKGELIGAGAFGRVYMGLNNETGQLMAVKQVTKLLSHECQVYIFWVPGLELVNESIRCLQNCVQVEVEKQTLEPRTHAGTV